MSERTERMSDTDERLSTADLTGEPRRPDASEASYGTAESDADTTTSNQPLLSVDDGRVFRERWERIQVSFVDEPQESVRDADALVAELMRELAKTFADERTRLEDEWSRGGDVSTEDLRRALQHYRSFFQRLLSA